MFELTNDQRKCFALPPVLDTWKKVKVKPGPYNRYSTYAFLDGTKIMKIISFCDEPEIEMYHEYTIDETLTDDKTKILPKTDKGKPQNFTVSNLEKKTRVGMALYFSGGSINLTNNSTYQSFYCSVYEGVKIETINDFKKWIEDWCFNTGEKELKDIDEFANRTKIHQKFKEGDFFRFRINRNSFGYGRILVDYAQMRKKGILFWDIFMGKPLCVAAYHIVTEDENITPQQLIGKKMLPSQMIMDNIFFYGECEIIGTIPLEDNEADFPIHYGKGFSKLSPKTIHYQCGKTLVTLEDGIELYSNFRNGCIGFYLNIKLPILKECIKENSNAPFWNLMPLAYTEEDLRNPKFHKELSEIKKQVFG